MNRIVSVDSMFGGSDGKPRVSISFRKTRTGKKAAVVGYVVPEKAQFEIE